MKKLKLAILFGRIGPYHNARINSLLPYFDVTCIESNGQDGQHHWKNVSAGARFEKITLFQDDSYLQNVSPSVIKKKVFDALDSFKPDLLAITGWYEKVVLSTLLWGIENNVPRIMMTESNERDFQRKGPKEFIKKRILKCCHAGVAGGKLSKQYFEKLDFKYNPIGIYFDIVDNNHFKKGSAAARKTPDRLRKLLSVPENYFFTSCRFIPKKNIKTLLLAYAGYVKKVKKPWSLILAGDGPLKNEIIVWVKELGLENLVKMPGYIQYSQMPAYYGLAKVFILPSTTEQWGLVVNEAMAAGLPVLVSEKCGCAPDLVKAGVDGFQFDPNHPEEIRDLMIRVASDKVKLNAMGKQSQKIVGEWSPENFAKSVKKASDYAFKTKHLDFNYFDKVLLKLLIYCPNSIYKSSE